MPTGCSRVCQRTSKDKKHHLNSQGSQGGAVGGAQQLPGISVPVPTTVPGKGSHLTRCLQCMHPRMDVVIAVPIDNRQPVKVDEQVDTGHVGRLEARGPATAAGELCQTVVLLSRRKAVDRIRINKLYENPLRRRGCSC